MQSSDNWTLNEFQDLVRAVKKRAATEPSFRVLLLRDPNAALGQIASKPLPSSLNVRILEQEGYDVTIVLPDPASASGELSESALQRVAGGDGWPYPPAQWPY